MDHVPGVGAALRDEGDSACGLRRMARRAHGDLRHPAIGADGVGPDDAHARGLGHILDGILELRALVVPFGEPRRQHLSRFDALGGALAKRFRDALGADGRQSPGRPPLGRSSTLGKALQPYMLSAVGWTG